MPPTSKPAAAAPRPSAAAPASDLPPGVPQHMAGMVVRPRASSAAPVAAPAAPAVHPTFGAPDASKVLYRSKAAALRTALMAGLESLRRDEGRLAEALALANQTPEAAAVFREEGIDLALLASFHAKLQELIALTRPS